MTSPADEALDWKPVWTGVTEPSDPTLAVIERLEPVEVELGNLVPVNIDFFVSCVVDEDPSVLGGDQVPELVMEDCLVIWPVDRSLGLGLVGTPVAEPSGLTLDVSEISRLVDVVDVVLGNFGPSDTDFVVSVALDDDPSVVCFPVSLMDACETVSVKEFEGEILDWVSDEVGVELVISLQEVSAR